MEIFTMTEQDIDKLIRYVISCKDELTADDSFDIKDVLIASGIFDTKGLGLEG